MAGTQPDKELEYRKYIRPKSVISARDFDGLSDKFKEQIESRIEKGDIKNLGVGGTEMPESIPFYDSTETEKVIQNKSGAWIILGKDRHGTKKTGYGGMGHTHCASIDLVTGRYGRFARRYTKNGAPLYADPNYDFDAARIYISQKTNVDENFGLVAGPNSPNTQPRSAVAMKADNVRIVARESIKLVTGFSTRDQGVFPPQQINSQGGQSYPKGIDLIAGNDASGMQPLVLGGNLRRALRSIINEMSELNGLVYSFMIWQMRYNSALREHTHISPFFAKPTLPSELLLQRYAIFEPRLLIGPRKGLEDQKKSFISQKFTYLSPMGKRYINSLNNSTN